MDESSHALSFHSPFCDSLRVLIFVLTIRSVYLGAYFYFTKHFESTVFYLFLTSSFAAGKQQRDVLALFSKMRTLSFGKSEIFQHRPVLGTQVYDQMGAIGSNTVNLSLGLICSFQNWDFSFKIGYIFKFYRIVLMFLLSKKTR